MGATRINHSSAATLAQLSSVGMPVGETFYASDVWTGGRQGGLVIWNGTAWVTVLEGIPATNNRLTYFLAIARAGLQAISPSQLVLGHAEFAMNSGLPYFDQYQTGAGASSGSPGSVTGDNIGVSFLQTGTTATGRSGASSSENLWRPSSGYAYFDFRGWLGNISTGAEQFTARWGFSDILAGVLTENNAAGFRHIETENGGNYVCYARNGGGASETVFTAVTPSVNALAPDILEVVLNGADPANATATYFINGVQVGEIANSLNVPKTNRVGVNVSIHKSVGVTSRFLWRDYAGYALWTWNDAR